MSIESAFVASDAHYRNVIKHDTWGHLFPEDLQGSVTGYIRIAKSVYGDVVVVDQNIPIEPSPWFHESMMEFVDGVSERMDDGEVWEIFTECWVDSHIESIPEMWAYCIDGKQTELLDPVHMVQRIHFQNCGGNKMLGSLT